jgi:hypothetical protein
MRRHGNAKEACVELEVMLDLPRHCGERSQPGGTPPVPLRERIPRVTRLMALAVKYQEMVDRGDLRDYADIARLGYVSRARITQIMNLSNLAPDIQEALLFPEGPIPPERRLRGVVAEVGWKAQRRLWRDLIKAEVISFQQNSRAPISAGMR